MAINYKFGEFDSAEEINRAAAAQKAEGDIEALKALAKENGIDEMDVEDYVDDMTPVLCTPLMAANGKLDVELAALGNAPFMMQMWVDQIRSMLGKYGDVLMRGVRRKGKSIVQLFAKMIVECSRSRKNTPSVIVDEARKIDPRVPMTLPIADISRKRFEEMVLEYYIDPEGQQEEEKTEVAPAQQEEEPEEAPEETAEDSEDSSEDEGTSESMMPEGGDGV